MHMKVLQTRRAVRGIHMRVGPKKGRSNCKCSTGYCRWNIKGSVGVIRDVSEIQKLTNELNRARQIIRTLEAKYSFDDIIGDSDEMTQLLNKQNLEQIHRQQFCLEGNLVRGKSYLHMLFIMVVIENTINLYE